MADRRSPFAKRKYTKEIDLEIMYSVEQKTEIAGYAVRKRDWSRSEDEK